MTYAQPARMQRPRPSNTGQQVHIDFRDLVTQAVENERQRIVREAIRVTKGVNDEQPTSGGRYPYTEPREGTKVKAEILAALERLA